MAFDLFHLANPSQKKRLSLADIIGGVGGAVGGIGQGVNTAATAFQDQGQNSAAARFMGGGQPAQGVQGGAAPLTGQIAAMNGAGGAGAASGAQYTPQDVEAAIRQYGGPNANKMLAMASTEGMYKGVGDSGSSFGWDQMHFGGMAPGGNSGKGLGDTYRQQTGQGPQDLLTKEGMTKNMQWLAQHPEYLTPDQFHGMKTPQYQQRLQGLEQGGGGAQPQQGGAQPQQMAQAQPQQGFNIQQD